MDGDAERFFDAVGAAHPGAVRGLVGTKVSWADGGPDPLDLIGYAVLDAPVAHWHAVTYGLAPAGHGFELSVRVRRGPDGGDALPGWVFSWLQNQARYVVDSGNALRPGDQMPANSPIREGSDTALTAMLYRLDPLLDPLVEPAIVQVVAVTEDELRAKRTWQFEATIDLLERTLGAELIVDLDRGSVLDDPDVAREAREGARRDGSSTTRVVAERLEVRPGRRLPRRAPRVSIDALVAGDLGLMIAARLGHGRDLSLHDAHGTAIHLTPGERNALAATGGGHWRVDLTPDAVRWLDAELAPRAGIYTAGALAPLELEVRPIDITDRDGAVTDRLG